MWSNCLFFALRKYLSEGGYLVFRKSRLGGLLPHVLWVKDLKDAELEHFVPVDTTPMLIAPPWFEGYIKYDDK